VKNPVKALYQTSRDYLPYFRDVTKAEFREVIQDMGYDQLLLSNVKESVVSKAKPKIQEELNAIGLEIVNYKVKDIIPQKEFREALNKQGIAVVEGQARVTRAAYDLTEADLTMQKDKKIAEGKAAYGKLRLVGLAEGAKEIHGVLRNHELTRDVIVADRYSEGVEKARNGTIYVAAGGRGPTPVLDFTPPNSGSGEKKEEADGDTK
jgi:regulator of protease activity HflC (stomatin/prohibitin superfamily)